MERKRNLLRIGREKKHNPNIISSKNLNSELPKQPHINKEANSNIKPHKRIKTSIKSQHLGNRLNPDYIGKYKGGSFIIAGCGESVNLYEDFSEHFVIGVNDIGRILTPDFLVVVNDIRTFARGRWEHVRSTLSPVIFSHLENPGPIDRAENLCKIELGNRSEPNLDRLDKVDFTLNSPYMAIIIAYQLGARKIGMVGVDFTQDHFFEKTGTHKLTKHLKTIDNEYLLLRQKLEAKGILVANLSPISALQSWDKMSLQEFTKL